jgi:hypothetical protein
MYDVIRAMRQKSETASVYLDIAIAIAIVYHAPPTATLAKYFYPTTSMRNC